MGRKNFKNRSNKINLVFDETKRRDFLTGFHKRKLKRKKDAQEKLEKQLKEERKRIKSEAKESYKKLVVSHRPIPEVEELLKEEYEEGDVTVKVCELSTNSITKAPNLLGVSEQKCKPDNTEEDESEEEILGMELKQKLGKKKNVAAKFETEKQLKKELKKQATKNVKKSKIFQKKNKLDRMKQKKKSFREKKQRIVSQEKVRKKRGMPKRKLNN